MEGIVLEMEGRPSRSDIHLSKEEEAKLEDATRDYFDGIAPKRHSKPQRSEPGCAEYHDAASDAESLPELAEFQRLQTNPEKIAYTDGSGTTEDEFTETEYYKDLNCVDKHHHTTGTGFINIAYASKQSDGFALAPYTDSSHHPSTKGNPARNEWIPSPIAQVSSESGKPSMSEN